VGVSVNDAPISAEVLMRKSELLKNYH